MPELPEVETVKEILKKQILGKRIINIDIYYSNTIENVSKEEFVEELKNEIITDIKRYGKYLIFIFEKHSVISHLRMEGKFFIKSKEENIDKHEHVVFTFDDSSTLRYHDTRKFGKMVLLKTTVLEEIMTYKALSKLGKEANDETLDASYLYEKLHDKNVPIKTLLLDQTNLAGLGNIYVDEVCHLSKLHPEELGSNLNINDFENIVDASKKTLKKAISEGGTTIRSYTSSLGVTGRFQQHLLVHTKETCFTCGNKVKKIRVGGRGTYYCSHCQPKKKKVIGITGVIGSGKSSVVNYLKEKNYQVIDSDKIVKELYFNQSVVLKIKEAFGEEYIENSGINRIKLGSLIYNNENERLKLNSIIHPLVKKTILKEIKNSKEQLIFVDVPLLYEAKFEDICDFVIVIYTNELLNLERLSKRDNISLENAKLKVNAQLPIFTKCYFSDFIIDNSFDLCYTYKQIDKIIEKLK